MQVRVENTSTIERRLTVIVPAEQVESAYKAQVIKFAQKANIKGFRPGKVPVSYIEQHFSADTTRETLNEVIHESLKQALTQENILPVAMPRIEPKNIKKGESLEYVATVEIMPVINEVNFKLDAVEKLVVDVTDADVDRVVTQLQKQHTKWQLVTREAKNSDRVVIDFKVMMNGEVLKDQVVTGHPLELGSNVMIPGFETGLIGAKTGETRTLEINFPADYHNIDIAGKLATFEVTVQQVFEAEIPELNEEFIKRLGVKEGDATLLKEQIKQSLMQERDRVVKDRLKSQVYDALLAQNPIEVPPSMISKEASSIHDEMYPDHQHQENHHHSADESASFQVIAKKRVMLGFLVESYTKNAQLTLNEDRVNQRIKEIASVYENPAEVETWLSSSDRLNGIKAQVMEDMVVDKLLESVTVTEKVMTYAELKGIRV